METAFTSQAVPYPATSLIYFELNQASYKRPVTSCILGAVPVDTNKGPNSSLSSLECL